MSPWHLVWIIPASVMLGWCLRISLVRAQSETIADSIIIVGLRAPRMPADRKADR